MLFQEEAQIPIYRPGSSNTGKDTAFSRVDQESLKEAASAAEVSIWEMKSNIEASALSYVSQNETLEPPFFALSCPIASEPSAISHLRNSNNLHHLYFMYADICTSMYFKMYNNGTFLQIADVFLQEHFVRI
jgi:hypothetical protein